MKIVFSFLLAVGLLAIIAQDADAHRRHRVHGRIAPCLISDLDTDGDGELSAEERAAGTCTPPNSQPNHPVRDAHSDPRELEGGEHEFEVRHTNFPLGSAHDSFRNCSDPNLDEHYEAPCDPVRNQYGRPIRPGGFPDEPMIVERRIHEHSYAGMRNAEQVQPGHPIPRANISVYVEDHHPYYPVAEEAGGVYPRTEFPIGMMKEPYTATGGYGGLAGPP